jgi:hypothetical protein
VLPEACRDFPVDGTKTSLLAPNIDMSIGDQPENLPPKREPFEFSKLRFIVKLVTSPYGCYKDPESTEYDGDEDDEEEYDAYDPWLKVSVPCSLS